MAQTKNYPHHYKSSAGGAEVGRVQVASGAGQGAGQHDGQGAGQGTGQGAGGQQPQWIGGRTREGTKGQ